MENAIPEMSFGFSATQILLDFGTIIFLSAAILVGTTIEKLKIGKSTIIICCIIIFFIFYAIKGRVGSLYARPYIALYNQGLCYYDDNNTDHFYEWHRISNLVEKTGRSEELLFLYDAKRNVSIPKLTIEIADMKSKFETFMARSRLEAKSDTSFQCPDLNVIFSQK